MTNEVSFGQRITAPWRWLAGQMKRWRSYSPRQLAMKRERAAYRHALLTLGRKMLIAHERDIVLREGSRALIVACIDAGITHRDDIIRTVGRHHIATGRLTGIQLTKHTGTDPEQDLWVQRPDGQYALLPINQ